MVANVQGSKAMSSNAQSAKSTAKKAQSKEKSFEDCLKSVADNKAANDSKAPAADKKETAETQTDKPENVVEKPQQKEEAVQQTNTVPTDVNVPVMPVTVSIAELLQAGLPKEALSMQVSAKSSEEQVLPVVETVSVEEVLPQETGVETPKQDIAVSKEVLTEVKQPVTEVKEQPLEKGAETGKQIEMATAPKQEAQPAQQTKTLGDGTENKTAEAAAGNQGTTVEKAPVKQEVQAEKTAAGIEQESIKPAEEKRETPLNTTLGKETDWKEPIQIKVGDGEPLNAQSKQFPNQLAERIVHQAKEGKQQFDIKLTPRELGEINIKIVFENGRAEVLLSCSNKNTMNLLTQNAQTIGSVIQNHTGSQTTVVVEEGNQAQQDTYDGSQHNGRQDAEQEQKNRHTRQQSQDFIQQLRLGLVDLQPVTFE